VQYDHIARSASDSRLQSIIVQGAQFIKYDPVPSSLSDSLRNRPADNASHQGLGDSPDAKLHIKHYPWPVPATG
jgi:hypothetical protein